MFEAGWMDLLQWPAMAVTLYAAWLVASLDKRRREQGFWWFLASNVLWIAWGWQAQAWALIVLQVGLFAMNLRGARKNAVMLSKATVFGQVAEQLVPLLPDFPYDLEDARFLGAPVDYIVFDGYAAGDDVDIVFVEVKTGNAKLSRGERRIRDAVREGRVRFETVRL